MGRIMWGDEMAEEHHRRMIAEENRLVREFIVAAGGYVTPENLVVVPNRPADWTKLEWPTFAVIENEYIRPKWHLVVDNPACRDKASMFLSNHNPQRTNMSGGVLVLCPAQ